MHVPAVRTERDPTIYEVQTFSEEVIEYARVAPFEDALELHRRVHAYEEYLAIKKLAGPMQTASRHLERRLGELLGASQQGKRTDLELSPRVADVALEEHTRRRFRLIASYWAAIEPGLPLSRAAALRLAEAAREAMDGGMLAAEEETPALGVTVEAWNAAGPPWRAALLSTIGRSKFNIQKTDSIEWARWSWNPVTGCLHPCPYCYARDIANRFFSQGFTPVLRPDRLTAPGNTRVPALATTDLGWRNVFVGSMADLFGKWVPEDWIRAVLAQVEANPQWNFLFLTKFPNRLAEFTFPENAWVGTTVDCQARVANAEQSFRRVNATVKWLSVEPMLERLEFSDLALFDWVVMGGASGSSQTPEWRPPQFWIEELRDAAHAAGCMVYQKTNLIPRLQEYPGQPPSDERKLPAALRYIPSIG